MPDDNAEEDSDIDNDPAISEPSTSNSAKNAAAKKTRKKRALVSTITKNKETINAKLRTSTMIDPLLAKWNQMPGDISSPNKLFSAMLRTVKSDLSPNLDEKYFDASENMRIEFSSDNTYNFNDYECDQIEATLPLDQSLIIRQTLKGFEINEIPVADSLTLFRYGPTIHPSQHFDWIIYIFFLSSPHSTVHRCEIEVEVEGDHQDDFDPEQLDFTFDANAATEEATDLRTEDNLPCGDHEDASDDENTEEDDFVGCQRSEYAYEHVTWTGSPHWKFLRTMPKPRLPDANNNNVGVSKRPTNQPEPIPDMEVGTNDDTFISSTAKRTRQPRIRVHWDAQNLQMPPNFCIPDDFFECLPNSKIYSSDPIRNEKVRTQCRKKLNEEYIQPASEDDANDNDNFEVIVNIWNAQQMELQICLPLQLGNDHEGASNDDPMVGNQSECVPHTQTTGQSSKTIVKQTQMVRIHSDFQQINKNRWEWRASPYLFSSASRLHHKSRLNMQNVIKLWTWNSYKDVVCA